MKKNPPAKTNICFERFPLPGDGEKSAGAWKTDGERLLVRGKTAAADAPGVLFKNAPVSHDPL